MDKFLMTLFETSFISIFKNCKSFNIISPDHFRSTHFSNSTANLSHFHTGTLGFLSSTKLDIVKPSILTI